MTSLSTAERVERLTAEYRSLLSKFGGAENDDRLSKLLVRKADWTPDGAVTVVQLARIYGSFVLANALAMAEALEIEDGAAGI